MKRLVFFSLVFGLALSPGFTGQAAAVDRPEPDVGRSGPWQAAQGTRIRVSGESTLRVAPDRAWITLTVESRDMNPAKAQAHAATAMAAVQKKLEGAALAADALRTLGYRVEEEIDWQEGKRRLLGFKASNTIEVRIDDPARVGEVLGLAVSAGSTAVDGIRFDTSERELFERDALRKAVAVARQRAEAAAAGAGLTVIRVLSVEEAGVQPIPRAAPMQRSAMLAESAPPVPISAGEIEISAQVEMMVLAR